MTAAATAQSLAVARLRAAISSGELRPGDRVHQEALAARIGVSLIPVREALRVLEGDGLITYHPRRGYFVTELRLADVEEIYALRALLEGEAIVAALPSLDDAAVARIAAAADACATAADVADLLDANRRFHFSLFEASGRPHLVRLIRSLWDATEAYRALYYGVDGGRTASARSHAEIVAALRGRDAAAAVAAQARHRDQALAALRGVLAVEP